MTEHRCEGCGATLRSVDELERESRDTGRSWFCTYCRTPVPAVVAERLSHRHDGQATDRHP